MLRGKDCRFEAEWPADTAITTWNSHRQELNTVIRAYNDWQIWRGPVRQYQHAMTGQPLPLSGWWNQEAPG